MDAATPAWPLSAAVTAVLRDLDAPPRTVLVLTLKELVLRRAWRLDRRTERAGLLGRPTEVVTLVPGDRAAPDIVPLAVADRALRRVVGAEGRELSDAVRRLVRDGEARGERLRDAARDELATRGLADVERRRLLGLVPRTVVRLTASGESWRRGSFEREEALETAVRERGPQLPAEAAALGGLVLLLSPGPLAELDAAMAQLRAAEHAAWAHAPADTGPGDGDWVDVGPLDLGALDLADLGSLEVLEASFDAAASTGDGGGGGGDGGGGGGS
jgi:hypothetical protein